MAVTVLFDGRNYRVTRTSPDGQEVSFPPFTSVTMVASLLSALAGRAEGLAALTAADPHWEDKNEAEMKAHRERLFGLASDFPALQPLLDENVRDYGEILPYLFLADVCRWIVPVLMDPESDERRQAEELLDVLASWLTGEDEYLNNLVGVAFVESLPYRSEPNGNVRELLGPVLENELQTQRGDS